ncbi:unnamed protein product (macronuclear) [Paramecium tetraurelia]|uniref:RRM domain-containing protein n=3 Tax=Paramecium TaxID=5884 RepID=A0C1D1_PARTE|nr:uncharacterized protein GSPATT00034074001 [Paramecium tetraurelia]CAD8210706.1 unnamed protein product [Paramecium pentaurelia]CAD8211793.1 unnamed protein product [Paramecium octaurelia]CAK64598.1 unnamed protein product [Paramecium tetraurelia]|eukprot:XP_001431996.1 hypothetical protein (macronuclear) [Paramecium tetraurelia strain d4-2]
MFNNPYPNPMFNNQYFELIRDNQQFQPQKESTHSLYVDGIPNDAQEREVAHIFRPYPGFQRVRLIKKQTQKGREYLLCFVDFDDALQATIVMQTLQGYRFDKNDKTGLKIYFANNPKQEKQNKK